MTLVLLCGTGFSACTDAMGGTWICGPILSALNGDAHDCQCPCGDDDCQEHKVIVDYLQSDSLRVPAQPPNTSDDSNSLWWFNTAATNFEIPEIWILDERNSCLAVARFVAPPEWMHVRLTGVIMVV